MNDNSVAKPAAFDASMLELGDDATAIVEIEDAQGNPTGLTVTVYSSESERAISFRRKTLDRRLQRVHKRGGRPAANAEDIERDAMELRVLCTKEWSMLWNGVMLPCTEENKRMVYSRAPLIRQQVDDVIGDAARFTKG